MSRYICQRRLQIYLFSVFYWDIEDIVLQESLAKWCISLEKFNIAVPHNQVVEDWMVNIPEPYCCAIDKLLNEKVNDNNGRTNRQKEFFELMRQREMLGDLDHQVLNHK
jgi:hypothetical protein